VESPTEVLDLFQEEFIDVERDGRTIATVEELFMLLYFFKTQIRNISDEQGQTLIKNDYRINLLIQMIFDQYDPSEI
jgi:hypothetical protein